MQILYNGVLFSPHRINPTAMLIDRGRILRLGSDEEILSSALYQTQLLDLNQKSVLPGFTDSHIHLSQYATTLTQIQCDSLPREEILKLVQERARSIPIGTIIRGHGWDHNLWGGRYGTLDELNSAAPDHPVFLTAKSLHAAWTNTDALNVAGIAQNTPDPPDGIILRDGNNQPSGILLEGAMRLVEAVIGTPTLPDLVRLIQIAQKNLNRMGITAVHDFDDKNCRSALEQMCLNNQMTLRVHKIILLNELEMAVDSGEFFGKGDAWVTTGAVKVFADGALGPQTAAMLEPYEDSISNCGILLKSAGDLAEIGISSARGGIPLAVHAIGDLANRTAIQAIGMVREYETLNHFPHLRHRIEHVQIITPEDLQDLHEHNIIASVQPYHALADMDMAMKYLGKRTADSYAYGSMARSGTQLVFGSDAPVEKPNPILALHAACTRRRLDGYPSDDGWHPEEKLSLEQAIDAHTRTPGYAAGWEGWYGKLQSGYAADLVIFPIDPYQAPLDEIVNLKPESTMVAGKWIDFETG